MGQLDELGPDTAIRGALQGGLANLDLDQKIEFQLYSRLVLPLDGYVFWTPTVKKTLQGALHFSQEITQAEDETVGLGSVVFTSNGHIADFAEMPTNTMYVAWHRGWRYAFQQQSGRFDQAGLYHYAGAQIAPALLTQLLDPPASQLNTNNAIVSNSLPLWLQLNGYVSPYSDGFSSNITLYPSFAVPPNLVPPYGSVHIEPSSTQALAAAPYLSPSRSHYQLCQEDVRITLYGLQNNAALDFLDCVNAYSVNYNLIGIMNIPTVRDGKRTQPGIEALAMQKIIEFKISYHQARVADIARQLITHAQIQFIFPNGSAVGPVVPPAVA